MGYKDLSVKIDELINIIIVTLDARDPYTCAHSERVAALSVLIATEMGLGAEEVELIHMAAHLHDIGKIGIPDTILNKEGRLGKDELIKMQSHSVIGRNILHKIECFREIEVLVLHHHERYDGMGYPAGLKGEEIPLGSRIIAVADSFDAITSDRSYRPGCSYHFGFYEVIRHIKDQFCPAVINCLNDMVDDVPTLLDSIDKVTIEHTAFIGHEDLIHSRRVLA